MVVHEANDSASTLCFCFCLALFSFRPIVAQQKSSPPIEINQPIPLPNDGNLTIDKINVKGDYWDKGTIGFKLLFSPKPAAGAATSERDSYRGNLYFALDDVKLLVGEKFVFPNSILMGRPGGGLDFVLQKGRMHSLGIGIYGNELVHKGMIFVAKDKHVRFIGSITGPVYIYFVVPEDQAASSSGLGSTDPSRTLYLRLELDESVVTANVKVN